MTVFLYICIVLTLLDLFLIVYAWTLPLFPKQWREKVNSVPNTLNPRHNNDSLTGMLIIIVTAVTCSLWGIFFYWFLFWITFSHLEKTNRREQKGHDWNDPQFDQITSPFLLVSFLILVKTPIWAQASISFEGNPNGRASDSWLRVIRIIQSQRFIKV